MEQPARRAIDYLAWVAEARFLFGVGPLQADAAPFLADMVDEVLKPTVEWKR